MSNPFAHEPEMEARQGRKGLEARPVLYELQGPEAICRWHFTPPRTVHVCRLCRTVYVPKPPDKDDLVCPTKLLQVMKEKVL